MNPIVDREKGLLELEKRIDELKGLSASQNVDLSSQIAALEVEYAKIQREIFGTLSPWHRVNMARHPKRPTAAEYLARLDQFDELHGDRHFHDDPAIIGGFAKLRGRRILAIGQQRGRDTKENLRVNFGMVKPEGYRKVRRLFGLASRLGLPIVTFIDTKGADPGIGSEERAQSEAIASCLYALAESTVPSVSVVVGEGGSGGALALGMTDRILMLEHSIYSVAGPEAAAAILFADATKAPEAAASLRLTSEDLLRFGIVDEVVAEPLGGAHRDRETTIERVLAAVDHNVAQLSTQSVQQLQEGRYEKYRRIGALNTKGMAAPELRS
ncbi:MAG: acetyl-CoA carboxylase carboxyltransferase subunit alpha [Candidatus Eremiobacteraeota bacterium]|nr:acetyl-CoA carboxylase carboxyltransferase subunit alpha [Candidatus Eremiobacteraeota bacterium]